MALDTVIICSPESALRLGSPGYKKGTLISHLLLEESRNKKEMIELYLHLKRRAGVPGGSVRGAWRLSSVERVILDLRVVNSSPALGIEFT